MPSGPAQRSDVHALRAPAPAVPPSGFANLGMLGTVRRHAARQRLPHRLRFHAVVRLPPTASIRRRASAASNSDGATSSSSATPKRTGQGCLRPARYAPARGLSRRGRVRAFRRRRTRTRRSHAMLQAQPIKMVGQPSCGAWVYVCWCHSIYWTGARANSAEEQDVHTKMVCLY